MQTLGLTVETFVPAHQLHVSAAWRNGLLLAKSTLRGQQVCGTSSTHAKLAWRASSRQIAAPGPKGERSACARWALLTCPRISYVSSLHLDIAHVVLNVVDKELVSALQHVLVTSCTCRCSTFFWTRNGAGAV